MPRDSRVHPKIKTEKAFECTSQSLNGAARWPPHAPHRQPIARIVGTPVHQTRYALQAIDGNSNRDECGAHNSRKRDPDFHQAVNRSSNSNLSIAEYRTEAERRNKN